MLSENDIKIFCNRQNYDIRITKNGRWIDQKCAPDVVMAIADCIHDFIEGSPTKTFTSKDIWTSAYAIQTINDVFRKPSVTSTEATNEYDKFFQQPMELLAHANILKKDKIGRQNQYSVNEPDILEYIALRERNSYTFLTVYIEKVLEDSNLNNIFDNFFQNQDKSSFDNLKRSFSSFTISNTKINGEVESNRIFTKVLNPLAYSKNKYGTERGYLSNDKVSYDMLMYNRSNFRDIFADKPRGVTRKEFLRDNPPTINEQFYIYQSNKAKRFLRSFNDKYRSSKSEHIEMNHQNDNATHMHHIFPDAQFPKISHYFENLIALTPTQHLNYAHPNGHTRDIDEQYQELLLLSKASRIEENIHDSLQETIYDFTKFLYVLNVGLDDEDFLDIDDMDFTTIVNTINLHYN